MQFETIRVEISNTIGRLTLNRPECLNAMNATMLRELVAAARWFMASVTEFGDGDALLGAITDPESVQARKEYTERRLRKQK
ncbi:MAG TPA: hypothetical protein VNQ79_20530 [Blastocatellia bacterium]|nr:hypothetical protein [Blastocatellia bacterium]